MNIEYIKENFKNWNKKKPITIGNNRQYKIVGCANVAFKVLKFEPQPELNNKGGWSQVFWPYKDIPEKSDAQKVITKMEEIMKKGGQSTL